MTSKVPRMPAIGESVRLCGRLVEIQDVTPPVVRILDYIFEETSATVFVKVNGIVLKELSTFNDFSGPPSAAAIAEAQRVAVKLGDAVEVVVVEKRVLVRKERRRDRLRP